MKAVVFGGSGFIGSHVADYLVKQDMEVRIFDLRPSKYLSANQEMILGDMQDQEQVEKAIEGVDYVYHFAGIADIKEAQERPIETVKANILSTIYILEACVKYKIKRFVYASTIYVYSDSGSFYRSSKQSCELFIENYHQVYGLNYTVLRYGSLFGERANQFNFIHNAIRQALTEKKITRQGDGSEIRDYINVHDAAKASVEILFKAEFENSYVMLTGSQTIRMKDLLLMIREMLKNEVEIEYTHQKMDAHYEITPYAFRPRVAKKYIPEYYHDLGQGILETIYEVYEELKD